MTTLPSEHVLYETNAAGVEDTIYGWCTCQSWWLAITFDPKGKFRDVSPIEVARKQLAKEFTAHTLDIRTP